jgi:hypothetical protein
VEGVSEMEVYVDMFTKLQHMAMAVRERRIDEKEFVSAVVNMYIAIYNTEMSEKNALKDELLYYEDIMNCADRMLVFDIECSAKELDIVNSAKWLWIKRMRKEKLLDLEFYLTKRRVLKWLIEFRKKLKEGSASEDEIREACDVLIFIRKANNIKELIDSEWINEIRLEILEKSDDEKVKYKLTGMAKDSDVLNDSWCWVVWE